jgi:hypothetical protein
MVSRAQKVEIAETVLDAHIGHAVRLEDSPDLAQATYLRLVWPDVVGSAANVFKDAVENRQSVAVVSKRKTPVIQRVGARNHNVRQAFLLCT